MSSKIGNTLGVAIGAAFIGSLSLSQLAAASPAFQASDLAAGYMLAAAGEGKCGEGKCGEGKCGIEKMDSNKDGKISMDEAKTAKMADLEQHFKSVDTNGDGFIDKAEMDAHHAAAKKGHEGSCGGDKKKSAEGSCGGHTDAEGSCGGKH